MPEDIHWQKYKTRFHAMPARLTQSYIPPGMCVCIPVYAEPDLLTTMESLLQCDLPDTHIEVLLMFNKDSRMSAEELNQHDQGWNEVNTWIGHQDHQKNGLTFLPIYISEIPARKGGVGWARKLTMDEGARRLDQNGILLCLDADCTVKRNYLRAVFDHFQHHKNCNAASIYFEHPLEKLSGQKRDHIVQYELHLRYLVHALRWTGHPFAYHTVGSAMAVRRNAYLAQGGMNTRQAGEDFYFLQKFIEIGELHEINNTVVYPSARISARVPFGTGRAMQQLEEQDGQWATTSIRTYAALKPLFSKMQLLYVLTKENNKEEGRDKFQREAGINSVLTGYLESTGFFEKCIEISTHTASDVAFRKRFFRYFNSFEIIRCAHALRDSHYPDVPVAEAAALLARELNFSLPQHTTTEDFLLMYRMADRK